MKIHISIALLILCTSSTTADIPDYGNPAAILLFADHLFQEQDYLRAAYEYERYLFLLGEAEPLRREIQLRTAKSFQCAGEYEHSLSLFESLLKSIDPLKDREQVVYEIGLTYFRMQRYGESLEFLQDHQSGSSGVDPLLLTGANLMMLGQWQQAEVMLNDPAIHRSEPLRELAQEGLTMRRKSPAAAGMLSAIVPGLGKIYAGELGDGIQSLLFIGLFGTLSFLSFRSDGVQSLRGWLYASAGGILHAGNIYGSVVSAKRYNRLREEALLQDVETAIPTCSETAVVP